MVAIDNVSPWIQGDVVGVEGFDKFNQALERRNWKRILDLGAAHTLAAGEADLILGDVSGGSWTLTLPVISTIPSYQGWCFWVKTKAVSGNQLTIDAQSPNFVDGSQTRVLNVDYEAIQIVHGGSRWWSIGHSTG